MCEFDSTSISLYKLYKRDVPSGLFCVRTTKLIESPLEEGELNLITQFFFKFKKYFFWGGGLVTTPKIFINLSRTYEKKPVKENHIGTHTHTDRQTHTDPVTLL